MSSIDSSISRRKGKGNKNINPCLTNLNTKQRAKGRHNTYILTRGKKKKKILSKNYLVSYQFKSKPIVMGFAGGEHEYGRCKKPR
jgi:hypothetical protein